MSKLTATEMDISDPVAEIWHIIGVPRSATPIRIDITDAQVAAEFFLPDEPEYGRCMVSYPARTF